MEDLNIILPSIVFWNYSFRYPAVNCQADIIKVPNKNIVDLRKQINAIQTL